MTSREYAALSAATDSEPFPESSTPQGGRTPSDSADGESNPRASDVRAEGVTVGTVADEEDVSSSDGTIPYPPYGPVPPQTAFDDSAADYADSPGAGLSSASPTPIVVDAMRRYLHYVVSRLADSLSSFDGTTNALRMCPGAKVAAQPGLKAPDGTEEFAVSWAGIAHAVCVAVLQQPSDERDALRGDDVDNDAAQASSTSVSHPLTMSVAEAREVFAAGLQSIVSGTIGSSGSPTFRRYGSSKFVYASELEAVSRKLMDEWLSANHLPDMLGEKYASIAASGAVPTEVGDVPVQSVEDLDEILLADLDTWIASFFPLCQQLKRGGAGRIRPIWADTDTLDDVDKSELAYQVYTLSTLQCLLKNKEGQTRGVLMPKAWLEHFLEWLSAPSMQAGGQQDSHSGQTRKHNEERNEESGSSRLLCPGPIDTYHCVHVPAGNPSKHWLLAKDRDSVDVVPERLFDYLCLLFGSGPRYLTYGVFSMHDAFVSALAPKPLMVEVTFVWEEKEDEAPVEQMTTVFVEEAVRRSDLAEVFRLALALVQEQEDTLMPRQRLALFTTAVYGSLTLHVSAKYLYGEALSPPLEVDTDTAELTVADLMERMTERLLQSNAAYRVPVDASSEELSIELRLLSPNELATREQTTELPLAMDPVRLARCGQCGLTNIGNTCYMNSALQVLTALKPFREHLLSFPVSRYPTASITTAYVRLMTRMWSGQLQYAETRELKEAIGEKERRFAGFQQQDANEFVEVLLDRMEEEVNHVSGRSYRERLDTDKNISLVELSQMFWDNFLLNNTGPIPKDFFHQSKTVFRCLTCGETSTVFDNNVTLSLNMKEPVAKRQMRAMVLVTRTVADPAESAIAINLSVRVPSAADGTVTEQDLLAALRDALRKSRELTQMITAPTRPRLRIDVNELDGDVPAEESEQQGEMENLDYTVGVLEVPEQGTVRAYAVLRRPTNPPVPEPVPAFKVWYFLKDHQSSTATAFGLLARVEDLPQSTTALTGASDAAANEEVGTGADAENEETGAVAPPASPDRPLSLHIIRQSKVLAARLLRRRLYVQRSLGDASVAFSTDYMGVDSGVVTKESSPSKPLELRVLYRKDRLTPLLDIAKTSAVDGDEWLRHCRRRAGRVPRRRSSSSGDDDEDGDDAAGSGASTPTEGAAPPVATVTSNIVVFVEFDGIDFERIDTPTIEESVHRGGWNGGPGRHDGGDGTSAEDDDACTLEDCLSRSQEADTLRGDDSWYCPHCKSFRETCVQRSLFRLPPCLIISFKRFKMLNSYHADKNNTTVSFPTNLSFAPYLDEKARDVAELNPFTQYKLRGVVYHSGSLSFGHYTASVYSDQTERWVYCNDTNTSLEKSFSPSPHGAYILCYEQVRPIPMPKT